MVTECAVRNTAADFFTGLDMARRRPSPPSPALPVTAIRAARLFRLVSLLRKKPHTRSVLIRRLSVGVRDFYRDLDILRRSGVEIAYEDNKYTLQTDPDFAESRIPFPNPCLTLGEAEQLACGRSGVHRRLKEQIAELRSTGGKTRKKK